MKRNHKHSDGFTLLEMLIVVAIIAILITIAIPTFTKQLEKSREAVDAANIRSYYAELMAAAISDDSSSPLCKREGAGWKTDLIDLKQKKSGWETPSIKESLEGIATVEGTPNEPQAGGTAWLEFIEERTILHYGAGSNGTALTPAQQVKQQLENSLKPVLPIGDLNTVGRIVASNKRVNLNAALQAAGFQGSAYITIGNDYINSVLQANHIQVKNPKIVTVTTDGKGLTEHKAGESINAVQYLYYKAKVNGKDQMVLFGTREVTITVKQVNKENKIQKMEFDTSDAATGNSWTKAS